MEITLESIISLVGLLVGGSSVVSIVTWRFARKKAAAEAKQAEAEAKRAEAEAKKAEAEAAQEKQEYYQRIVDDIAKDRDYYKQERDELRTRLDDLARSVRDWKLTSEEDRSKMKSEINMLRRQMDCLRPLLCGRAECGIRMAVNLSDIPVIKPEEPQQHDIKPYDDKPNA